MISFTRWALLLAAVASVALPLAGVPADGWPWAAARFTTRPPASRFNERSPRS